MDEELSITVGGRRVVGRFLHRSDRAIEVAIVEPYQGMSLWLHMVSYSRSASPTGLSGEEGMKGGRRILRDLYRVCSYIDRNRGRLAVAYREFETLRREFRKTDDRLFAWLRASLEEAHAAGTLSDRDYRTKLRDARLEHSRHHESLWTLKQEFFKRSFPFVVDPELMDQTLAVLKREL